MKNDKKILFDEDVEALLPTSDAVELMEQALRAKAMGHLIAPPRFQVDTEGGSLVFTAGAEINRQRVIGFRVYDTFRDDHDDHEQLVAVYDSKTGAFKGLVIGDLVGAIRTGAIGGVAVKHLARPHARRIGIIGSGLQARTQLEAACAVREIESVKVYSRSQENRQRFSRDMSERLHLDVKAVDSAEVAVIDSDILICATTSGEPVFNPAWLRPGMHINTIGPKFKGRHEVSVDAAVKADTIVTDSFAQIEAYPKPFFLADTPYLERIKELSALVSGAETGRTTDHDITMFCSVGLAGTEVLVADEALRRAHR